MPRRSSCVACRRLLWPPFSGGLLEPVLPGPPLFPSLYMCISDFPMSCCFLPPALLFGLPPLLLLRSLPRRRQARRTPLSPAFPLPVQRAVSLCLVPPAPFPHLVFTHASHHTCHLPPSNPSYLRRDAGRAPVLVHACPYIQCGLVCPRRAPARSSHCRAMRLCLRAHGSWCRRIFDREVGMGRGRECGGGSDLPTCRRHHCFLLLMSVSACWGGAEVGERGSDGELWRCSRLR